MGPLPYNELYSQWTAMEMQSDFKPIHRAHVENLARRVHRTTGAEFHEGVLSSQIARTVSKIAADFDNSLEVVHQLYSPDKSSSHIDIAILDALSDAIQPHSLLEINWTYEINEFPENEVTAFARLLQSNTALKRLWIPVFVLSKTHFRISVAFYGVGFRWGFRWAYSEIFFIQVLIFSIVRSKMSLCCYGFWSF